MDTVGAGDTFNAVLLAALRDRLPLPRALRLAVEVTSAALASSPRRLPAWDTLLRRERVAGQPGGRSQRS
jgi:sugar/nucleoside kinase (ribokinase family)